MQNLTDTADRLTAQLAAAQPGDRMSGLAGLSDECLLQATAAIERLGRQVDSLRVAAAAEIADRSRPDLGTGALSAKKGCRNAADLIERVTLVSGRTAATRIMLGTQTRPSLSLTGHELPPRFPAVAAALTAGTLGLDAAHSIVTVLRRTLATVDITKMQSGEHELVAAATGTGPDSPVPCAADETARQAHIWQAFLDPDGTLTDEQRALTRRGFSRGTAHDGLMIGRYALMPDVYAKLQRVFDAHIFTPTAPTFLTDEELAAQQRQKDPRSWQQQRHDVFAAIIDTISRSTDVPTIGGAPPTIMISVRAEDLHTATGTGHIDGIPIPVSLQTVHQYACTGGTQQALIADNGALIALGTEQRCFNRQQRRAIHLRDGTCIIPGCTIPAYWTEIHHVIPASLGGPTHTDNEVTV